MFLVKWVLGLLLLLLTTAAQAQTNPGFVQGAVLTAAALNAAFASKQDYTNGTFPNIVITPSTDTLGYNIGPQIGAGSNGGAATGILGAGFAYNQIYISQDNRADFGTSPSTYGQLVYFVTGGSNARGIKIGFQSIALRNAADNLSFGPWDLVAGAFSGNANASDGGTNTSSGARGAVFGYGGGGTLSSGATNYFEVAAAEFDVAINTGASSRYRFGVSIADNGNLQAADSVYDAGLTIGAAAGSPGFKYGVLFDVVHGGTTPVTSTYIAADPNQAMTVAYGINFNNTTFTTAAFSTGAFQVLNNGSVLVARATAIAAGSSASPALFFSSTANFGIFYGSGAPSFSAAQGSLYLRSDGAINNRLYINTNGSTGWTAFNTTS